ncbi:MAG: hypothetical protein WC521_05890 [Bdellovibrionales bacterium]|jgi:hypothetical protein
MRKACHAYIMLDNSLKIFVEAFCTIQEEVVENRNVGYREERLLRAVFVGGENDY